MTKGFTVLLLLLILLGGGWLRLRGIEWDQGTHSHPDERYLTMVVEKLRWPDSLRQYFDPAKSGLNPHVAGYKEFVYGTFPLLAATLLCDLTATRVFDTIHITGRAIAAAFDIATIALVFLIGSALVSRRAGLMAAACYALSVLAIQHAHFFVVDPFLTFFSALALLGCVHLHRSQSWAACLLCGAGLGLGLATKLTAVLLLPAVVLSGAAGWWAKGAHLKTLPRMLLKLIVVFLLTIVLFRIFQPYAFAQDSLFSLAESWIASLRRIASWNRPSTKFPPSLQWIDRSPLFGLDNLVRFGLGVPLGTAAMLALSAFTIRIILRPDHPVMPLVVFAWTTIFVHSFGYVKVMRYFLPIYPALAVMTAAVWERGRARAPLIADCAAALILALTLVWALSFTAIYTRPNTRASATRWIFSSIPANSVIATEPWEEPQPVNLRGKWAVPGQPYRREQIPIFEAETEAKARRLADTLVRADYIVINSQRGYATVSRVPWMFPIAIQYYEALFAGRLGFELVKTFESFPRVFGYPIRTDLADESFSVYDHAKVFIFRKAELRSAAELRDSMVYPVAVEELPDFDEIMNLAMLEMQ